MTRLATRQAGRFRPIQAPREAAALPPFVMVGTEKVTKPAEVEIIMVMRSMPDGHRAAVPRLMRRIAAGMPPRDALRAFWVETGGTEEDGAAVAAAISAQHMEPAS